MRIIDADALKRHYSWWKGGTREMTMDEAKNDFDTIIDLQPTIEPKHGRWLPSKNGHGCDCSECGTAYRWSETDTMRYCKRCGARMNEVENESE